MSIFDSIRRLLGGSPTNGSGRGSGDASPMDEGDMIPCEDALRLVHDYLDGELEGVSRAEVKRHFEVCERCYPHLRFETSYREAVRRAASGEQAPPELKAKVSRLLAEARSQD